MFSKEISRQLRHEFWISFGESFPRKWVLYNTKIKGLSFKFHFDTKKALVAMDIEDDLENRIEIWEKITALKSILLEDHLPNAHFDETFILDNGKEISRVYIRYEQHVSIHNKDTWRDTMVFFNKTMNSFEQFFEEYKDVIKP